MSGSDSDNDEPWDCDFGCGFADRDFNIVGLHEQTCRLRDNAQPIGTNQADPETEKKKNDGLKEGRWFWLGGPYDPLYVRRPGRSAQTTPDINPRHWVAYPQPDSLALDTACVQMRVEGRTSGKLLDLTPDHAHYQVCTADPFRVKNPRAPTHMRGEMSVAGYRADLW